MSTRAPSVIAAALGQIRYRLALAVIGFSVFTSWFVACAIPLCVYASYFDAGGRLTETEFWALMAVTAGLTYRWRGWIIRKALEEASPEPVSIWTGKDVVNTGLAVIALALGSVASIIGGVIVLTVAAFLVYGGYLLLTMLSLPMAILIGAIIIAVAILIAASA
jgi:hypothetical protein